MIVLIDVANLSSYQSLPVAVRCEVIYAFRKAWEGSLAQETKRLYRRLTLIWMAGTCGSVLGTWITAREVGNGTNDYILSGILFGALLVAFVIGGSEVVFKRELRRQAQAKDQVFATLLGENIRLRERIEGMQGLKRANHI